MGPWLRSSRRCRVTFDRSVRRIVRSGASIDRDCPRSVDRQHYEESDESYPQERVRLPRRCAGLPASVHRFARQLHRPGRVARRLQSSSPSNGTARMESSSPALSNPRRRRFRRAEECTEWLRIALRNAPSVQLHRRSPPGTLPPLYPALALWRIFNPWIQARARFFHRDVVSAISRRIGWLGRAFEDVGVFSRAGASC
jgi:hypothetical protein